MHSRVEPGPARALNETSDIIGRRAIIVSRAREIRDWENIASVLPVYEFRWLRDRDTVNHSATPTRRAVEIIATSLFEAGRIVQARNDGDTTAADMIHVFERSWPHREFALALARKKYPNTEAERQKTRDNMELKGEFGQTIATKTALLLTRMRMGSTVSALLYIGDKKALENEIQNSLKHVGLATMNGIAIGVPYAIGVATVFADQYVSNYLGEDAVSHLAMGLILTWPALVWTFTKGKALELGAYFNSGAAFTWAAHLAAETARAKNKSEEWVRLVASRAYNKDHVREEYVHAGLALVAAGHSILQEEWAVAIK